MAAIVWPSSKVKDATSKDPSLRAKIGPLITKLSTASTSAGLHLEPIKGAQDRRVRTARVNDFYRAVLFELSANGDLVYVFHGIWPHDEAIKIAESITVGVNPNNGATEVTRALQQEADAVEQERRRAAAELAAAKQEAEQLAREAARIQAANDETRRRNAEATKVASRDLPLSWPTGLSVEVLHNELGIDEQLSAAALEAQHESELLEVAGTAQVPWQAEALLSLATGSSVEDIRKDFELRRPQDVSAEPTDAEIIAGLRTRAAQSSFTWIETDEDLRKAIDSLTFAEWRLFLHPQQRALVERNTNGPMRVSGGAGTGKTVVAVHRAVKLAERDQDAVQEASVLLTTYTRNLADDLRRQVAQLAPTLPLADRLGEPGVLVSGLDKLARSILQRAGEQVAEVTEQVLGRRRTQILSYAKENLWQEVLTILGDQLPEALCSTDFLASEYELVVLPQRVTNVQQYLRVRRPGRGVALDRSKRAAVWKAMERYRDRSTDLEVTSFSEQLALAAAWLDHQAGRGVARPFRHVVVDEAQDLTPAHLMLLRALVEPGPDDLFLAEDSHQRIYGKKIVLSHYGIQVRGRSRRLTRNYRTTRQNLSLAFGILEPGAYEDLEGQAEEHHYVSPRSGPEPLLLHAANHADELRQAAEVLKAWLEEDDAPGADQGEHAEHGPETIAVLVRDRYQRDAVVNGLGQHGVELRAVDREAVGRGRPVVMTMHRAKGLEFRKVLLFDVSASAIPRVLHDESYSEADKTDALLRERSLLYVAATRARDQVAISWSGEASPLLREVNSKP